MKLLKHLPNAITSGNLLCGSLAVIQIFSGDLVSAALLVFLAALLDFFDGFAARLLKVNSPVGKDLDSLADVITFGLVPGLMLFKLIAFALVAQSEPGLFWIALQQNLSHIELANRAGTAGWFVYLPYLALLVPVFSALRLARFNHDSRQSESFIGLPTPANAMFVAALLLNLLNVEPLYLFFNNPFVLVALSLLSACLLVAELPLLALKFKGYGWQGNQMKYLLLGISLLLLLIWKLPALPLLIPLYILFSLVNNIFFKAGH